VQFSVAGGEVTNGTESNVEMNHPSATPVLANWMRIVIPVALTVVLFVLTILFIVIPAFNNSLLQERQRTARYMTESIHSLIQNYHKNVEDKQLTEAEAQSRIRNRIRGLRYGNEMRDYFWLMATRYHLLVHPYRKDLEEKDLRDWKDPDSKKVFVEFTDICNKRGEGYSRYKWQWYDSPDRIVDKVGYVKLFAPWQWIVGTGIYLDDMQADVARITAKLLWTCLGIAGIAVVLSIYAIHEGLVAERARDAAEGELRSFNENLERRVARRTAELQAANHELEAFSYSVSHDLRSPLRGINGFTDILLEDHSRELSDDAKALLERIRATSCRMGRLIDDILQLARVSRHEVKSQTIDLAQLARTILDELTVRYPEHPAQVTLPEKLEIEGDPTLLTIILQNLLDNAMKFTSHCDAPKIEFGVRTDCRPDVYFVRDNGTGFSMDNQARLFRPFERLHSGEEFAGTGVGLATVHRAVQRHGGRIWAEAGENQGATFFFTLQPG